MAVGPTNGGLTIMDVKPKISRVEVVVNTASGSVSAQAPDEMRALLSELGLKSNVCAPESGDLTRCLRDAVDADPDLLAAALLNLLDNSHRFNAHQVTITALQEGVDTVLRVQDDGDG